ncbi:LuxR C-terminal-related transcriptional regulator [Streptomyces sp. CA-243310]|uniref:LuxR C-terminal-related transcriptional regulator n=1 Tax=Streptomyces sp. CA-243310 TaxID=3240056 RepID=UPI003D89E4E1
MLQLLGLSPHAEAVYRATLRHPDHGVAALLEDTGLSEREVRAALDELAALTLLKPSDQFNGRLRPVSPEVGLAALLASAQAELASHQARVETTRAEIAAIAAEHRGARAFDGATRLEGLDAVRVRLEELQRITEFECLSLNPGGAHRPDARNAATPLNEQALERGVVIRAVCRDSFRNDPDTLAYARWLIEHGGQMRTVPTVPIQMIIVDRRVAILPLEPAEPRAGALEVHSPGVVAALCALFEQTWEAGSPVGEQTPADDNGCTPMERTLLGMIAGGDTDEAAARKLGISLRTVRRMMAHLMERLEAASRFQAGVNATKRGWL